MASEESSSKSQGGLKELFDQLPLDRLKDEVKSGFTSLGGKAIETAGDKLTGATEKLNGVADGTGPVAKAAKGGAEEIAEGGSPAKGAAKGALSGVKDKVKEKLGGGGSASGGGKATKSTSIIEEIDVGVPVRVAYNQWTQFQDFSNFMKKVDSVDEEAGEEEEEVKLNFKAQVFWSHRSWEATVVEQVPDEKIVWRSKGAKGHVDGSVSFHELAPRLTRIVVVLEYYPQGMFERTGNLWRAQGRRARLELKHFRRHVMMLTEEEQDELEGWRGEVRDKEVERSHDEVVEEEQQQADDEGGEEGSDEDGEPEESSDEYAEEGEPEDEEYEDEPSDEYAEEGEPEDEEYAEEGEPEEAEEEPSDEYEEEGEPEEEPADEYDEELSDEEPAEEEPEEEEPAPRRRRRAS